MQLKIGLFPQMEKYSQLVIEQHFVLKDELKVEAKEKNVVSTALSQQGLIRGILLLKMVLQFWLYEIQ